MNKVISREYVEKNYIHKDIIRRLIKNLDKEEENLQKSISDEEREEYSDCSISYELCDIYTRREVLNKLLEETNEESKTKNKGNASNTVD